MQDPFALFIAVCRCDYGCIIDCDNLVSSLQPGALGWAIFLHISNKCGCFAAGATPVYSISRHPMVKSGLCSLVSFAFCLFWGLRDGDVELGALCDVCRGGSGNWVGIRLCFAGSELLCSCEHTALYTDSVRWVGKELRVGLFDDGHPFEYCIRNTQDVWFVFVTVAAPLVGGIWVFRRWWWGVGSHVNSSCTEWIEGESIHIGVGCTASCVHVFGDLIVRIGLGVADDPLKPATCDSGGAWFRLGWVNISCAEVFGAV